jgi:hypothetical protein
MNTTFLLTVGIIGFVLIILNAIFLGVIYFMRKKMAAVSQWPSTMGTVMMSTIEWRSSSDSGSTAYPVVQYSYQVNGQSFQSLHRVRKWAVPARRRSQLGIQPVRR